MKDVLDLAVALAREAGSLQRERFREPRTIETKSSVIDLVTDVDRDCDALILEGIKRMRPGDTVLTEESGAHDGTSDVRWVVDPLDGTTNYAHGFPHFAVSIGVDVAGRPEVGVVYDPMKDELFSARRGHGAQLNGAPIRVSACTALDQALLGTGFAYDVHTGVVENLPYFDAFIRRARALRRPGSAALDLAYVACGRFDGFWELSLHPWDVAAGLVLVPEAGGHITDFSDGPVAPKGERVLASNAKLHAAMLDVIAGVARPRDDES